MTTTARTLLLILSISLLQTSCSRDDDDVAPASDCQLSANVDGVSYRWELANCSLVNEKLQVGNIVGDEAEMTIEPIDGTGTFSSINPNLKITFFLTLNVSTQITVGDVEIQVTSFSNSKAMGTFEGIFTDIGGTTYRVENGRFQAEY